MGLNNTRRTRLQAAIAAWRQKIINERAAAEAAANAAREAAEESDSNEKTLSYKDETVNLKTNIVATKDSISTKITQLNTALSSLNSATTSADANTHRTTIASLQTDITTLAQTLVDKKAQIEQAYANVNKFKKTYTSNNAYVTAAQSAYDTAITAFNAVSSAKADVDAAINTANKKYSDLKIAEDTASTEAAAISAATTAATNGIAGKLDTAGGTITGAINLDGNTYLNGPTYFDSKGNNFTISSDGGRVIFAFSNDVEGRVWSLDDDADGNLIFNKSSSVLSNGGLSVTSWIKPGSTSATAANAGAGAIKYDTSAASLLVSNGSSWAPIYRERDGSINKPFFYLSDAIGAQSAGDATFYINLGNKAETVQYTINFDAAYPRFKATWTGSGETTSTSGANGCSQGTGDAYDWYSYVTYCMKGGKRPCSKTELEAAQVSGTGCSHDNRGVWTWTHDDTGNYWAGLGTGDSHASNGWYDAGYTGGGWTNGDFGVRCCGTGSSGGAYWEDDSL